MSSNGFTIGVRYESSAPGTSGLDGKRLGPPRGPILQGRPRITQSPVAEQRACPVDPAGECELGFDYWSSIVSLQYADRGTPVVIASALTRLVDGSQCSDLGFELDNISYEDGVIGSAVQSAPDLLQRTVFVLVLQAPSSSQI